MSTTVRISDETHERLVALAGATGRRMHAIVEDALAADDAEQWAEVEAERTGEAPTLADDLDGS